MQSPDASQDLAVSAVVPILQRAVSPDLAGVGLRTHALRYDNLDQATVPRAAEEFLIASRLRRWDRETELSMAYYFADRALLVDALIDEEPASSAARLTLPPGRSITAPLGEVVAGRRSRRRYTGDPLDLGELATLLRYAGSITAQAETDLLDGGSVDIAQRTVPSAGGLYPAAIWLASLRISDLPRGIYRYLPKPDCLEAVEAAAAPEDLLGTFEGQGIDLDRAGVLLMLVGQPWRSMRKYGPRGMRFLLHEVGGISQNLHLAAGGLRLASTDFSGFYDDEANAMLGIDGLYQALLHTVVVGIS